MGSLVLFAGFCRVGRSKSARWFAGFCRIGRSKSTEMALISSFAHPELSASWFSAAELVSYIIGLACSDSDTSSTMAEPSSSGIPYVQQIWGGLELELEWLGLGSFTND
jgi:hypothetical protein